MIPGPGRTRSNPANVPRMPTATISATGRRYRGLSAEERRADQRRRLVRAAINEFAARGYHRTSVEDIVRSARTSRTAFYAFFDNREAAMYGALQTLRCAGCSTRCAPDCAQRGARRRSRSRSASRPTSTTSCPIRRPRGSCCSKVSARRPRSTRCAAGCAAQVADAGARHLGRVRPRGRGGAPGVGASRSACSGILFESMLHLAESGRLDRGARPRSCARHRGRAHARTGRLITPECDAGHHGVTR